jgi:hypothetical protein
MMRKLTLVVFEVGKTALKTAALFVLPTIAGLYTHGLPYGLFEAVGDLAGGLVEGISENVGVLGAPFRGGFVF